MERANGIDDHLDLLDDFFHLVFTQDIDLECLDALIQAQLLLELIESGLRASTKGERKRGAFGVRVEVFGDQATGEAWFRSKSVSISKNAKDCVRERWDLELSADVLTGGS